MDNLTFEDIMSNLHKLTSYEIIEVLALGNTDRLIEALNDYIGDNQESITENLYEAGVI